MGQTGIDVQSVVPDKTRDIISASLSCEAAGRLPPKDSLPMHGKTHDVCRVAHVVGGGGDDAKSW